RPHQEPARSNATPSATSTFGPVGECLISPPQHGQRGGRRSTSVSPRKRPTAWSKAAVAPSDRLGLTGKWPSPLQARRARPEERGEAVGASGGRGSGKSWRRTGGRVRRVRPSREGSLRPAKTDGGSPRRTAPPPPERARPRAGRGGPSWPPPFR